MDVEGQELVEGLPPARPSMETRQMVTINTEPVAEPRTVEGFAKHRLPGYRRHASERAMAEQVRCHNEDASNLG